MKTNKGFNVIEILIILAIIGILSLLVLSSLKPEYEKQNESRHQNYLDCKAKTNDVEWCVKIIRPEL